MKIRHSDKILGGFWVFLSIFIFIETGDYSAGAEGDPGAAFFPRLSAVILILASVVILYDSRDQSLVHNIERSALRKVGLPIVLLFAYVLLMPYIGFLPSTVLYMILFMRILGVSSYLQLIVISLFVSLIVFLIFRIVLNIPLPRIPFIQMMLYPGYEPLPFGGLQ